MGKPFSEALIQNIPDELRTSERIKSFNELVQAHLNSLEQGPLLSSLAYTIQRRDGSRRNVQTIVSLIQTTQRPILCGVVRDITELKQREEELDLAHRELAQSYELTLEGWAHALEIRERETAGHSKRVAELACQLAKDIGMQGEDLVNLRRGGILHDIGKMGIPDNILLKPDVLTADEWVQMKQHTVYAFEMIHNIPYLQPALDIPYCHHEKWDGTGYPRGLKGEDIPLAARIFALADVYDALISDRPYRAAWSRERTFEYIREQSGKHFDPGLVAQFFNLMERDQT
jgi:putative nucleotidyltransferase with HDIG domain